MSESVSVVRGTGQQIRVDNPKDRTEEFDKPGEHLWVMTGMWRLSDPRIAFSGDVSLDTENLLTVNGPGCFKCEQPYRVQMLKEPCKGSLELL